jgi:uncharacterized protein (DUF2252 family)
MATAKPHLNIDQDFYRLISPDEDLSRLNHLVEPRASRGERLAAGKALRQKIPRSSHAQYQRRPKRDDPVTVLQAQNATRIPELVPLRMERMASSPFAFLRGAAEIMAADLAGSPVTGLEVMACGDMHVANVGLFASAERNLVFAVNDFDEVHPGFWEWDLKRLAASAAVAAEFLGGDQTDAEEAARATVESYVKRMEAYAEMGFREVWYELIDERTILDAASPSMRRSAEAAMAKARARGQQDALDRLTEEVAGQRRIIEDIPLIVREAHLADGTPIAHGLGLMLAGYFASLPADRTRLLSRYQIVDAARKVVGVGSVGTNCWIVLLEGLDEKDPLFLQVKEARQSVLAPFAPTKFDLPNQGQRVVTGQRMIQGSPDIFLGWGHAPAAGPGCDFYVRQLADMKGGESFSQGDRDFLQRLPDYARLCGWALALAHAKSGDPAMISGYCGSGDALPEAIGKYALAYGKQTEQDHDALLAAIKKGRIDATV